MADSTHHLSQNLRDSIVKAAALRLSDTAARTTTDYAEILVGSGAPSGRYGRSSNALLVYYDEDATTLDGASYMLLPSESTWVSTGGGGGIQVQNNTGGTIGAGSMVYLSGYDATEGVPEITDADADDADTMATHVATADISDGDTGTVDTMAYVSGLDTSGFSAVGDPMYLSGTAGEWTDAKPSGDSMVQQVGTVAVKHATTGAAWFYPGLQCIIAGGTQMLQDSAVTTAKIADDDVTPAKLANSLLEMSHSMPVLDAWAIDGDGAETNGAGMVGVAVSLSEASAAYCKTYDDGNSEYNNLDGSSGGTDITNDWQIFSDTKNADDAVYFGADNPFPELAIDMSATVQDYTGDALTWEYYSGSTWDTLTLAYDNTDSTAQDGKRSFQQDGAIAFVPPSDWASTTVDSQAAYWIRARITTAGNIGGNEAQTNSKNHELVSPSDGWEVPCDMEIDRVGIADAASTLHTTADVKFFIWNFTKHTGSGEITFAMDKRVETVALSAAWDVDDGDELACIVTQEDTAAEPDDVMLTLIGTRN